MSCLKAESQARKVPVLFSALQRLSAGRASSQPSTDSFIEECARWHSGDVNDRVLRANYNQLSYPRTLRMFLLSRNECISLAVCGGLGKSTFTHVVSSGAFGVWTIDSAYRAACPDHHGRPVRDEAWKFEANSWVSE